MGTSRDNRTTPGGEVDIEWGKVLERSMKWGGRPNLLGFFYNLSGKEREKIVKTYKRPNAMPLHSYRVVVLLTKTNRPETEVKEVTINNAIDHSSQQMSLHKKVGIGTLNIYFSNGSRQWNTDGRKHWLLFSLLSFLLYGTRKYRNRFPRVTLRGVCSCAFYVIDVGSVRSDMLVLPF